VTWQALTDSDNVPAGWLGGEKGVKTGYSIDVINGYVKRFCQFRYMLLSYIAGLSLSFLKCYQYVIGRVFILSLFIHVTPSTGGGSPF
jgi:hypothetical protein